MLEKIKKIGSLVFTNKMLLFILFVLLIAPFQFLSLPNTNLDNSWQLSINLAIKNHLIFGKDFVFTYGPLGYLLTGVPVFVSRFAIILFRVLMFANAVYFIYYAIKELKGKFELLFFVPVLLFFNFLFSINFDLLIYFYFLFYIFHYIRHRHLFAYIIGALFAIFGFYIKLNTGLIINFLLFASIIYFLFVGIGNKILHVLMIIFIILFHIVLIHNLNLDFKNYIINGLDVINYYNDAMFKNPPNIYVLLVAVSIISLLFSVMLSSLKEVIKKKEEWFLFINAYLLLYIIFKQSFVRADIIHYSTFFLVPIYFAVLIYLFTSVETIKQYILKIIPVLFVLACLIKIERTSFSFDAVKSNIQTILFYNKTNKANFKNVAKKSFIPDRMKNIIAKNTVDVIPTEISYIYFNNLNYNPRPIVQSYSCYSPLLMQLNYQKLLSTNAPQYILYHSGLLLEGRLPISDDFYSQLAILQRYQLIDTAMVYKESNDFLKDSTFLMLFKRSDHVRSVTKKLLLDTMISLNNKITLPKTNNMLFMESDLNYTSLGKIRRIIFQPYKLKMNLYTNNLMMKSVKGIIPELKNGVIINQSLLNSMGNNIDSKKLFSFFKNEGQSEEKIQQILFNGNAKYFNNKFRVKFYELILNK